jgi:hypothetical protein
MRSPHWIAGLVVGVLLTGCARQATCHRPETWLSVPRRLTPGRCHRTTDITLDRKSGTKSSKVGDTFTATVTNAVARTALADRPGRRSARSLGSTIPLASVIRPPSASTLSGSLSGGCRTRFTPR